MSLESITEPPVEEGSKSKHAAPKKRKGKRRHRAQYPTPEFYLFAFLLNLSAVGIASWLLIFNPVNIPLLATGLLGVVGLIISVYAIMLRPMESNKKLRKILIGLTAIYGFVLLMVQAINILAAPDTFKFF